MSNIELWRGDCLELMGGIPDKSVNMILCDLPYGTTACAWDRVILSAKDFISKLKVAKKRYLWIAIGE